MSFPNHSIIIIIIIPHNFTFYRFDTNSQGEEEEEGESPLFPTQPQNIPCVFKFLREPGSKLLSLDSVAPVCPEREMPQAHVFPCETHAESFSGSFLALDTVPWLQFLGVFLRGSPEFQLLFPVRFHFPRVGKRGRQVERGKEQRMGRAGQGKGSA